MAHLRFFREFCGTGYPAPERMFCEHRLTYAYCFSRHSYSALGSLTLWNAGRDT
jgi:hypothetical protein